MPGTPGLISGDECRFLNSVFFPRKKLFQLVIAPPSPPPPPPYNFIRPLLKYRHYTTQCLEFPLPSFISLQLTIHFFPPPFLLLVLPRPSSQGYFSPCSFLSPLHLPFFLEAKNSYLPAGDATRPQGDVRPTNFSLVPISSASECSFLSRFRQPFTIYKGRGYEAALLHASLPRGLQLRLDREFTHDGGDGMCVA